MKALITRLENVLKGLTAIESETVNLVTILRVDITQLAKARIAAEMFANGYRRPLVVQEIAKAIIVAEDTEERTKSLAQVLLNTGLLAKKWTSLLAPGCRNAAALARADTLSTLNFAEDFVRNFNLIGAMALEASKQCNTSANALNKAMGDYFEEDSQ